MNSSDNDDDIELVGVEHFPVDFIDVNVKLSREDAERARSFACLFISAPLNPLLYRFLSLSVYRS